MIGGFVPLEQEVPLVLGPSSVRIESRAAQGSTHQVMVSAGTLDGVGLNLGAEPISAQPDGGDSGQSRLSRPQEVPQSSASEARIQLWWAGVNPVPRHSRDVFAGDGLSRRGPNMVWRLGDRYTAGNRRGRERHRRTT